MNQPAERVNDRAERVQPVFPPGLLIEKRAYVVDANQVGWWVDPDQQTIIQAKRM